MIHIQNPILKGFNPDPSIIRVGEDYYIATSTFEWFPGVQIHQSADLVNWQLVTHPLRRKSQLDMKGVPDSCGVWAPCLSYDNGTFYLVYSNVKSFSGIWKDTPNYLVTTNDILGDWSEPSFLDSSGFDGSLFHDEDGSKWYLSLRVDHRKGKMFGGIMMQQYDVENRQLIGPVYPIFDGSDIGLTEGPHLYQKDGYYYLATAEGGTEYGHAVSIARSKSIFGPYELSPTNPLVSSRTEPDYYLQKSGHGDLVQTADGKWIAVFLTGRPLSTHGKCILGRETSIETVNWETGGWPMLGSGSSLPRVEVPIEGQVAELPHLINETHHFDTNNLSIHWQTLRVPMSSEWISLQVKPGALCLFGRESLNSLHEQSLIARRIQNHKFTATTAVSFTPTSFLHMAGLVCYYNSTHYHYLNLSVNNGGKRCLQVTSFNLFEQAEALDEPLEVPSEGEIFMKVEMDGEALHFYYSLEPDEWQSIGGVLDATILSDDNVRDGGPNYMPAFTGAFIGLCCQDLSGHKNPAYFDFFSYKEEVFTFPETIIKNKKVLCEAVSA